MVFRILRFVSLSIILFASIILALNGKTYAQLDPAFGTNGVVTAALGDRDATLASFVLPDGKIFIVAVASVSNQPKLFFLRYNGNGTPDSTYGTNGSVQTQVPFVTPNSARLISAARQTDGKIVVAGYDRQNFFNIPLVARLNEDGSLDTTFAGSGISRPNLADASDTFYSVLIQPDGKILLTGTSHVTDVVYPNFCLMRYLANGSVDPGFGTNGTGFIIHTSIRLGGEGGELLYLQSNGKIVVGSIREVTNINNQFRGTVRRYNNDGTIDGGFTIPGFLGSTTLQNIFVQPDDKILIGTQISKTDALERVHAESVISRYQANGTTDTNFGSDGQISFDVASASGDFPKGFQVMPDGQILVALAVSIQANRSRYRGNWLAFARLSPVGSINGKFLAAPTGENLASDLTILPDGKVLTTVKSDPLAGADGVKLVRTVGVPLENYLFHAIPFDFPTGLVAATDPSVYRPSTNRFYFYPSLSLATHPEAGDVIVPADYIGDFYNELAYFRPSTGTWHIVREFSSSSPTVLTVRWGMDGDVPLAADFNGDGKADPAVFRPSEGVWYIYYIADGFYTIAQWGLGGDKPVPGDYDGDGRDDIAVFRPLTGDWWIYRSSDGGYTALHFGLTGDIPVQEDYDGDGKFDIAVYRPSTGIWYRLNSSDGSFFAYQWGIPGDVPVPGNYDNDQKANVAVWRPSDGTWYVVNPDYISMIPYAFGVNGDKPLPAKD